MNEETLVEELQKAFNKHHPLFLNKIQLRFKAAIVTLDIKSAVMKHGKNHKIVWEIVATAQSLAIDKFFRRGPMKMRKNAAAAEVEADDAKADTEGAIEKEPTEDAKQL